MENKISSSNLKIIADDLNQKIKFNHISNIVMINSHDLIFSFSMYRKGKLFVSLNHQSPFVSLVEEVTPIGTIPGIINDTLRKMIKDGNIQEVHTVNDDRILAIEFTKLNDLYEKKNRTLIIELIPHRQNLIILEEGKILFATHYKGMENERPIVKGFVYVPIKNNTQSKKDNIDLKALQKEAEDYFVQAINERKNEKFKPLITHIKSRIKSLNNKLKILEKGLENAVLDLSYQNVGNMLLSLSYDKEELNQYIKENNIKFEQSLTIGQNAEYYFKKYKKAKRAIDMNKIEIKKAESEIASLELLLKQIPYLKEEDLLEISQTLFLQKNNKSIKKVAPSTYGCLQIENTKIYYGKNAKQNNELTFKKASKNAIFLHVKDSAGAHVIVENNSPSKEILLTAAEIALILSGKEDGEVQYTSIKNVKKGTDLGQALLIKYETIMIKNIRDLTKKLLINS